MIDIDEPFKNLMTQGMVKDEHGDTMSKSKGNVVPPSSVIEPYGADTMRLAILLLLHQRRILTGTRRSLQVQTALSSVHGV